MSTFKITAQYIIEDIDSDKNKITYTIYQTDNGLYYKQSIELTTGGYQMVLNRMNPYTALKLIRDYN